MGEEENIQEIRKTENPEEVNSSISQDQAIRQSEITNQTSHIRHPQIVFKIGHIN